MLSLFCSLNQNCVQSQQWYDILKSFVSKNPYVKKAYVLRMSQARYNNEEMDTSDDLVLSKHNPSITSLPQKQMILNLNCKKKWNLQMTIFFHIAIIIISTK